VKKTLIYSLFAACRYGGIYLDSDVVVLKPLKSFRNLVGTVKQVSKDSSFSGAVLVFEKQR
jgi:lactosylceramide 4-alpha-galactosyltransferase